ncbi:DUF4355 domain-containing protein [Lentilactobacillus senioris]|uniref:DUF4355 domain-containing protein n=1 Tax=Lentilactobacillus senioris TaxID=931534 RepID=UPI002280F96C|nr:DUF4355 domain-containing protein [Lentilactobacillus senioris]MCY9806566.1 DUF4355 domain-containing protein [Lentilactobacillus senioris]
MRDLLKLNLQMFADDGDGGSGDDGGNNENLSNDNQGSQGSNPDAIIFQNQSELDSWFDKRLDKATDTLRANWEKEKATQKSYEEMTPEEQRAYDADQREQELAERERKVTIDENRATVIQQLTDDELPVALAKVFEPALADFENFDEAYKSVTDTYRNAVKEGVDKQLAGSAVIPGVGSSATKSAGQSAAERRNSNKQTTGNSLWKTK